MHAVFDAFWRAVLYCLHPRVIVLSLLPVAAAAALAFALGQLVWAQAVDGLGAWLESSATLTWMSSWLEAVGLPRLTAVLPHVILLVALTPAVVLVSLGAVSLVMAPALVRLVAHKRFAQLQTRRSMPWWQGPLRTLWSIALGLIAMVLSLPMWLVPPLILLVPPLIWGWLTCRVLAFDALAQHASVDERRALMAQHKYRLLGMGLVVGLMGTGPSLIWSTGLMAIAMAPLLLPVSIWLYVMVFSFACLWFIHFCLMALQTLRTHAAAPVPHTPPPDPPRTLDT